MRKAARLLLGLGLAVTLAGAVSAADRAGVGFVWESGPTIELGPFAMRIDNTVNLDWMLSDLFAVGVFSSQGTFHGSHSYTDNTGANSFTREVDVDGNTDIQGIRISAAPFSAMSGLTLGLELGTESLVGFGGGAGNPNSYTYPNSDGTLSGPNNFGGATGMAPGFNNSVNALYGVNGHLTLVRGESKTVSGELGVGASLRFVSFPDTFFFGSQETNTTSTPLKAIAPLTSYNTLAITASIGLWF